MPLKIETIGRVRRLTLNRPERLNALSTELRQMVLQKAAVVQSWVDAGRMAPVDPIHLFFTIWAATQTYADFEAQVCAVLGRDQLTAADHARATTHVVGLVLRGCGLDG